MSQEMITDITLDHLPDLSDASLSFQIPADNSSADLLLADVTDGFNLLRRGTDDDATFATLMPTPYRGPPLTLCEITPKPESASRPPPRSRTPRPSSSESSEIPHPLTLGYPSVDKWSTPPRARSKPTDIALGSPLVSEERQEQLAPADVEILGRHPETTTHVDIDMAVHINEAAVSVHGPVPTLRPKTKLKPRTKSKPTVADGGISKIPAPTNAHVSRKAKNLPSSKDVALAVPHCTASQNPWPQSGDIDAEEQLVPPASMNDDIRMPADNHSITPTTSRMAERLVSYSQKLISSIGLYKAGSGNSFTEGDDSKNTASTDDARVGTRSSAPVLPPSMPLPSSPKNPRANDEPLRLSEISPRKAPPRDPRVTRAANPQDDQQRAMSPMRCGKKRSSMDAGLPSQEYHGRKKGKTVLPSAEAERGSSGEESSNTRPCTMLHEDQIVTNSETRQGSRKPGSPKSTLPTARTKYRPKLNCAQHKGPSMQAFSHISKLRQVHGTITKDKGKYVEEQRKASTVRCASFLNSSSASSKSHHPPARVEGKNSRSVRARDQSGPSSAVDLPLFEKPNATLPAAQVTKPVAFTFRVDARLEARKIERLAASEQGMHRSYPCHAVPDFRALHESHESTLACRKENIVPSGPVETFFFYTEQRAKERERFDEMVKRKEEEMQRVREEQRRLAAEEEERAIKELRRKAIPKANEVPEWYADMPKRKGTAV